MVFRVLFLHWFGVLQMCVLAPRTTLRFRVLRYLFLIGALTSLPAAIASEALARHYFQNSDRTLLNALIENGAIAAPVFYLLWRTRLGMSMSLLDGLISGAAVGAGFGFAEDAIYMIENTNLGYSPYTTIGSILFHWLPGGWASGNLWFPGHMALGALTGSGLAIGRRLIASRVLRWVPVAAVLLWASLIHGGFDEQGNVGVDSLWGFIYYRLTGSGTYLRFYLFAILVGLLTVDELWVRRRVAAEMPRPLCPISSDIAAVIESLGKGWKALRNTQFRLRGEEEIVQLRWELMRLKPQDAVCAEERIAQVVEMLRQETGSAGAARWTPWWREQVSNWWKAYRVAAIPVMVYAFWLVFLSPYVTHSVTQTATRSTWALLVGLLGIVLMVGRFVYYLRTKKQIPMARGGSSLAVQHCQAILMWSGFLTCFLMLKDLYDVGALPYPMSAQALGKYDQARSCLGNRGFDTGGGSSTAPIHTTPHPKKDESGGFALVDDRP